MVLQLFMKINLIHPKELFVIFVGIHLQIVYLLYFNEKHAYEMKLRILYKQNVIHDENYFSY
jgi:hypothetical protein